MGDVRPDDSGQRFVETAARKQIVIAALLLSDVIMLTLATLGATVIRFNTLTGGTAFTSLSERVPYFDISWIAVGISLVFLWRGGLYDLERLFWGSGEFGRVMQALAMSVVAFILATYAAHMPGLSRAWTILVFGLSVVLVSAGRLVVRHTLRSMRRRGLLLRRTLIVGANAEAAHIVQLLKRSPETGLVPIGCVASSQSEHLSLDFCGDEVPCLGAADDLSSIVCDRRVDTVLIASSAFDHDIVSRMIGELRGLDVTTHVSSGLFDILTRRVIVRELAGVPLITVKRVSLSRGNLATKRVFDLLLASIGVIGGLPMWLLLAATIKLESHGPVFYKQTRVGQDGKLFHMFKFRSMCNDADERLEQLKADNEASGPLFKMKNDPRVTRCGGWMRKFSIDEFPQLLNVLRGEMSLVGPRPPLPGETSKYNKNHWRRMEVPPGMTGLWQVSGRSTLTFDEMVRLDLYYIENWSVSFDLSLIVRTIPAVLFARGAY